MTTFTAADDLRGARFAATDLSGVVMRGVHFDRVDLDAPWLDESVLLVNGVDVTAHVEAVLDQRFPGRGERRAAEPAGLRAAWTTLEATWATTLERVAAMPPGTVDVGLDGEWSFAQTLRHLVMATDTWLRGAVLGIEDRYHPAGLPHAEYAEDGYDLAVFSEPDPSWAAVLEARTDRQGLVRGYLAEVTTGELASLRPHPWSPDHETTVLSCLHTILEEEWQHLRYAVRDLDSIAASHGPR